MITFIVAGEWEWQVPAIIKNISPLKALQTLSFFTGKDFLI